MFEKNMKLAYLLDFYGEALDERTNSIMQAYYDDDLSLSEIAELKGVTRQSVLDAIKTVKSELDGFEQKLGLNKLKGAIKEFSLTLEADQRQKLIDILEK
jgi:predicted DNA-binding protein YlxM (UPF0122 family)